MSTSPQGNGDRTIDEMVQYYRSEIDNVTGGARVQAYTTWSLLKEGYYSPDELIDLSLQRGFTLDNPITKIRRGTQIDENVIIRNGTVIEGERVSIGNGTILDNAHIYGNDIRFGRENFVDGSIRPGNLSFGDRNQIHGIIGNNDGIVNIGDDNNIDGINISNPGKQRIIIGNHNELHRGLNLNCVFPQGGIRIGHYNSLGRDGGGIISNSYRFNLMWWGDVLIGSHVETTRGAEILGFSLVGWPLSEQDKKLACQLFVNGPISSIHAFFERLWEQNFEAYPQKKSVGLYGVVKTKMSCLFENVKVKDGTKIQSSFLENIFTAERCTIYFTAVDHPSLLLMPVPDRVLERLTITQPLDWAQLPVRAETSGIRKGDAEFYKK